ncbi:MAG: DUF4136 domain-containing protein [Cytophagales bacterium]|nr:DUF4136 domain-containing protein [Cytophagales bacterium]
MHKFLKIGSTLAVACLLLAGCYPKGPEFYSDLDLTVTDYDPDYNFGDQKKYWMADTVEYITNIEDSEIDEEDVKKLLEEVASNFTARDYTRVNVSNPDDAEFVVTVSVIASRNTGIGWIPGPPCYPGWWGCWGGWYPPYWGGYYTFNYTTGSVIINWYDPQTPPIPTDGQDLQPVHWVSTFNGLVSSSRENNASRIEFSINQAFKQSPYIQSNK